MFQTEAIVVSIQGHLYHKLKGLVLIFKKFFSESIQTLQKQNKTFLIALFISLSISVDFVARFGMVHIF